MTVKELFELIGAKHFDCVRWNQPCNCQGSGIYIVSTSTDSGSNSGVTPEPRFDNPAIQRWIDRLPEFTIDGMKPTVKTLKKRLSEFWLPEENILYIGQTESSLSKRIGDYYRTELGARAPHSGGQWLKTLADLGSLSVYYVSVQNPKDKETALLKYFFEQAGKLPFANLKGPTGKKQHGLKYQRKSTDIE